MVTKKSFQLRSTMVHYRSEFAWPSRPLPSKIYKIDVHYDDDEDFVEDYNVNAEVTEGNSVEVVARVQAVLLHRPSGSFFEQADAVSGELELLSVIFCEPNGVASRVKHPRLLGDPSVHGGGFFHIDEVEIKPSHKGHDLGLRVLHEVLALMKDKWSLAVMLPISLGTQWCKWKENSRQTWSESYDSDPTPVQLADSKRNNVLIQKQFGRMGFVQAVRNTSEGSKAWFLTSAMYFSASDDTTQTAISRWLSKEQAAQIDMYQAPVLHEPTGLDKELHDFVGTIHDSIPNSVPVSVRMIGAGWGRPPAPAVELEFVILRPLSASFRVELRSMAHVRCSWPRPCHWRTHIRSKR